MRVDPVEFFAPVLIPSGPFAVLEALKQVGFAIESVDDAAGTITVRLHPRG